jgi:hypothetical protein
VGATKIKIGIREIGAKDQNDTSVVTNIAAIEIVHESLTLVFFESVNLAWSARAGGLINSAIRYQIAQHKGASADEVMNPIVP